MYKIVVYWRWDRGEQSADCFWCVPWPDMSNEEFDQEKDIAASTAILMDTPIPATDDLQDFVLKAAGYPEAMQMLRDLPKADLRARFNSMEREVFNSDFPVTREQIEQIKLNRR